MYYIIKLNIQLVYATAYIKLYIQYPCHCGLRKGRILLPYCSDCTLHLFKQKLVVSDIK